MQRPFLQFLEKISECAHRQRFPTDYMAEASSKNPYS